MPPLERMDFHDTLVLWGYVGTDRQGDPVVAQPMQLPCRWEEGQTEIPDPMGNKITVDSVIATTQDILENSIVWQGTLDSIRNAKTLTYLYEVVIKTHAKDLKGRIVRYEYGLRRYKDTIPKVKT